MNLVCGRKVFQTKGGAAGMNLGALTSTVAGIKRAMEKSKRQGGGMRPDPMGP